MIFIFSGCSNRQYIHSDGSSISSSTQTQKIRNSSNMHRATMRPYTVLGKKYYPEKANINDSSSGIASWYGPDFHNKLTSNGETYNMHAMTAAHKTLPMNTMLRVTNLENDKKIIVRINDRGPFVKSRIIDLSNKAAHKVDMVKKGTAPVRIEVIGFNGIVGDTSEVTQSVIMSDYAVQIGAFRDKKGAYKHAKQHADSRYSSKILTEHKNGSVLYRVYLTGFKSDSEARDYKSQDEFSGSFIVKE